MSWDGIRPTQSFLIIRVWHVTVLKLRYISRHRVVGSHHEQYLTLINPRAQQDSGPPRRVVTRLQRINISLPWMEFSLTGPADNDGWDGSGRVSVHIKWGTRTWRSCDCWMRFISNKTCISLILLAEWWRPVCRAAVCTMDSSTSVEKNLTGAPTWEVFLYFNCYHE